GGGRARLPDLLAEQQLRGQTLQRIPVKLWDKVTPAKPWAFRDTIAHLADFAELAADALTGGDRVKEYQNATDLDALRQRAIEKGRSMRPQDAIEWWRAGRAKVVEPLSHMSANDREERIAVDRGVKTFGTVRTGGALGQG